MKTRIAFEAPIGNTTFALEQSDYIFAIAPMLGIPEYAEAVRRAREFGKKLYIDNGVYEGKLMGVDEYLELCLHWKPEVVVAPDVILNCCETVGLSSEFLSKLPRKRPFEIMVVLQGRNDREKIECYWELMKPFNFEIVGFGLAAFEKRWRERMLFFVRMHTVGWKGRCHILGLANLADLCFWSVFAESIDTSLPFHLAQEGKELPFGQKETKSIDWQDTLVGPRFDLATWNLDKVRKALDVR